MNRERDPDLCDPYTRIEIYIASKKMSALKPINQSEVALFLSAKPIPKTENVTASTNIQNYKGNHNKYYTLQFQ